MVKNQHETLSDLKALHLIAAVTMTDEQRQYYTLALIAVAALWGVERELSQTIFAMETRHDQLLPLPAAY